MPKFAFSIESPTPYALTNATFLQFSGRLFKNFSISNNSILQQQTRPTIAQIPIGPKNLSTTALVSDHPFADIIPGTKKLGGPGAPITMPIGNKDDRWVFDDMDAVDIAIPDAPHADEIVIALALSCGGRPGARVRKP